MIKGNTLEKYLIEHCAPTLAGIKSASLFSCRFFSKEEVDQELKQLNETLNERGVYMERMLYTEDYTLIYTYRLSHLKRDMDKEGVKELLISYGYPDEPEIESYLTYLKKRLSMCKGFPHEIGVFLGYPLEDVKGFILHKGRDCNAVDCGKYTVMNVRP